MSLEAVLIKPVALAPIGKAVNYVHISPFQPQKGGYHSHAWGAIPPEKSKKAGLLPLSCVAFCLGYKRFRLLLALWLCVVAWALLRLLLPLRQLARLARLPLVKGKARLLARLV